MYKLLQTDSKDAAQAAVLWAINLLAQQCVLLNKYVELKHKHAAPGQTPPGTAQTAVQQTHKHVQGKHSLL
jgi:hypothetical protein